MTREEHLLQILILHVIYRESSNLGCIRLLSSLCFFKIFFSPSAVGLEEEEEDSTGLQYFSIAWTLKRFSSEFCSDFKRVRNLMTAVSNVEFFKTTAVET